MPFSPDPPSSFGEATVRIVVSARPRRGPRGVLDLAEREGIEAVFLSQVKVGARFDAAGLLDLSLAQLRDAYEGAIPRAMGEK